MHPVRDVAAALAAIKQVIKMMWIKSGISRSTSIKDFQHMIL
jgi:hypothetical protein